MSQPAQSRGPGRPAASNAVGGREALLRAARELIAERAPSQITLRAVAERAGVRPTLVQYYFNGKDDLLAQAVAEVAADLRSAIRAAAEAADSTEARLRETLAAVVRLFAAHPYLPRLVLEQMVLPDDATTDRFTQEVAVHNLALLREIIDEGQAQGELRDFDLRFALPGILGTVIFPFLAAPLLKRLLGADLSDPATLEALVDHAGAFVWNALRQRDEA